MRLRRLNPHGLLRLNEFLDALDADPVLAAPEILVDASLSETLEVDVDVEALPFASRFAMAEYLDSKLSGSGISGLERDAGLWAWLAVLFFDQLCPADPKGARRPGERARWILAVDDYRRYYRHLVAGPYRIYRAHREEPRRALAVLAGPANRPGDVAEQLASRQELVTNGTVMAVATGLYIDAEGQPKRGAAGRGPGSARRLAEVLNQYDLTWDLYSVSAAQLLGLLPAEFDRFRPAQA